MLGGIDPQALAKVQALSKGITAEIEVDYAEKSIKLSFTTVPGSEDSNQVVDYLVGQFPDNMAKQLSSFFGINGEIVEYNKPKE